MRKTLLGVVLGGSAGLVLWAVLELPGSAAEGAEPELIIYSGPNFTGHSLRLTTTVYDLLCKDDALQGEVVWNDGIRSMVVVSGTWRAYQHGRCNTVLDDTPLESLDIRQKANDRGWSSLVSAKSTGPLEIPDSSVAGWDDDISSIRLVSAENLPDWAAEDY